MRYRLGSFEPRPGSSDYAYLLENEDFRAPMTRALEEMLRVRLSPPATGDARPDSRPGRLNLLHALGRDHPDYPWVRAVHLRMRLLRRRGVRLRLLACEYEPGPDGFLTLAASAPDHRFEVFPGDWMEIGFAAMRDAKGSVRAWPRLLREVCANGSIVCAAEFEGHEGAAGIGEAVERFLFPADYEAPVQGLRVARETTVEDPRAYLDELQRVDGFMDLLRRRTGRIEQRVRSDGDPSLYGLMNAITAEARTLLDWRDRLDLEELAGRIAWLRRPVPSRPGGGVLIPV